MKRALLGGLVALLVHSAYAAENVSDIKDISYAKVLEVIDVMGYDYLRVDQNGTERWVAIAKAPVKVGEVIGYDTRSVMKEFKSRQLNRTFDEIVFANEVYLPQNKRFGSLKDAIQINKTEKKPVGIEDMDFVDKPYYTVEEIHRFRKKLKGKKVSVKAKVYKVSHDIMKRDWIHLGDGTGREEELTDDLVFTATQTSLKSGEEVIAQATIVIDKDFGFGYFYSVLGEDASFEQKD